MQTPEQAVVTERELERLFALIAFDTRLSFVDGLTPFRELLSTGNAPRVADWLAAKLVSMHGEEASGVAFALTEYYLVNSAIDPITRLCASDCPHVREGCLDALGAEPPPDLGLRAALVALLIAACADADPRVRGQAARSLHCQSGWQTALSASVGPLRTLLTDDDADVRMQAACAVGGFAKARIDISSCVVALGKSLSHERDDVREYGAWALWQAARTKQDIEAAVPDLIALIARMDGHRPSEKNALGALTQHMKNSPVRLANMTVAAAVLEPLASHPPIAKFLARLRER